MKSNKKVRCSCGLPISPAQQRHHEKSVWHQKYELVQRAVEAGMTTAEIARLIGSHPSAVSYYLRVSKNGTRKKENADGHMEAVS